MIDCPTRTCKWCHQEFVVESTRGPIPDYCSHSHRQLAYLARKKEHRAQQWPNLRKAIRLWLTWRGAPPDVVDSLTDEVVGIVREHVG